MQQLIQPDLSVTGTLGYCEQYVELVFHTPKTSPYAWAAWEATQYKHLDTDLPTDAAVLLWYSYTAPINGVTRNWGHVTVNVPGKGIYSSPWSKTIGHDIMASIAEVEQHYTTHLNGGTQSVVYVGWSEDINGLRVAEPQEDEMEVWQDSNDVRVNGFNLYGIDVAGSDPVLLSWVGKSKLEFFKELGPQVVNNMNALNKQITATFVPYAGSQLFTKK